MGILKIKQNCFLNYFSGKQAAIFFYLVSQYRITNLICYTTQSISHRRRESAIRRFLISDHLCSVSNISTHIGLQIISQSRRIVVHKTINQTNLTTTLILLEINLHLSDKMNCSYVYQILWGITSAANNFFHLPNSLNILHHVTCLKPQLSNVCLLL